MFLRREREQGTIHLPCSADNEQDWQLYPVVVNKAQIVYKNTGHKLVLTCAGNIFLVGFMTGYYTLSPN